MNSVTLSDHLSAHIHQIDTQIKNYLPTAQTPLATAMHYCVLNGGKRLRPLLVILGAELFSELNESVIACACAVEFIHCYSLVHDDLPAMDNDNLRRGKPTCHIAFDEATAILVGDTLQSLAFETICNTSLESSRTVKILQLIAQAIGVNGMAGGQALDIQAQGRTISLEQCQQIHHLKTGALLEASLLTGAIAGGNDSQQIATALRDYASAVGLAFQIKDDLLDASGDTDILGKEQGSDAARDQSTYATLLSTDKAEAELLGLYDKALSALDTIDADTTHLADIAKYIIHRSH